MTAPSAVPAERVREALRHALYGTDRSGTPDARLRRAAKAVDRPDLRHGDLHLLTEAEARLALDAVDSDFGCRTRGYPRGTSRRRARR